jgi:hypothetical protein
MATDMESVVRDSVGRFGGHADGMFNTANFQQGLRDTFQLRDMPDGRLCSAILRSLDFVRPLPGGCHWKYRPPGRLRRWFLHRTG